MAEPLIIDGKSTAAALRTELKADISALSAALGSAYRQPGLAVVLVGEDPASQIYVRSKVRACAEVGIHSFSSHLPGSISQKELEDCIDQLNDNPAVDGILIQMPLPVGLNSQAALARILPAKDVDGFTTTNMGCLALGLPGLQPCTPAGIMELLKRHDLSPSGKHAVVIGRSNLVGKPLAMLLAAPGPYANATVTLCHSGTRNIADICRQADFLFAAIGKAHFITKDMVKPGAVIVDVGINRVPSGLAGDVDYSAVAPLCRAITPVPGGVGPMTIVTLLQNTVQAWKQREHIG